MVVNSRVLSTLISAALITISTSQTAHAFFTDYSLINNELKDVETLSDALSQAEHSFAFRLRYEDVSEEGVIDRGAQALTLRSRFSFETQRYKLFSAGVRFDDVKAIPNDENYFSGTNGETDDLLIADPEMTEVSSAWLAYDIANTLFKYGKQDFRLGSERLIGSDSWRQNNNTFNGLSIKNESLNYTTLKLARFTHFENSFSPNHSLGNSSPVIKLFNLAYRGFWMNELALYGLTIDGRDENPLWSTETYGISFNGEAGDKHLIKLYLDYAKQVDKDSNPLDYQAKYHKAELEFAYDRRFGIKSSYEMLGSDGGAVFVTPLASLNEFQGALDIFNNGGLGNIAGGIRDRSWEVFAMCSDVFKVSASYNSFYSADRTVGFGDLGEEFGIEAHYQRKSYSVVAKYADYNAKAFGSDQRRAWLSVAYSF